MKLPAAWSPADWEVAAAIALPWATERERQYLGFLAWLVTRRGHPDWC